MDSPNVNLLKVKSQPKTTKTKKGIPLGEIEEASIKSKIKEALGKYGYDEVLRENMAKFMLGRPETLHLHPPTIAGAIALMDLARQAQIQYFHVFINMPNNPLIERVLVNIVPTNLSEPELTEIRLRTKADLIRYMSFIRTKVRHIF